MTPAICTTTPVLDGTLTFGTPTLDEWQVFDVGLKPRMAKSYAYVKFYETGKDGAGANKHVPLDVALWVSQESYRRLIEAGDRAREAAGARCTLSK